MKLLEVYKYYSNIFENLIPGVFMSMHADYYTFVMKTFVEFVQIEYGYSRIPDM